MARAVKKTLNHKSYLEIEELTSTVVIRGCLSLEQAPKMQKLYDLTSWKPVQSAQKSMTDLELPQFPANLV